MIFIFRGHLLGLLALSLRRQWVLLDQALAVAALARHKAGPPHWAHLSVLPEDLGTSSSKELPWLSWGPMDWETGEGELRKAELFSGILCRLKKL